MDRGTEVLQPSPNGNLDEEVIAEGCVTVVQPNTTDLQLAVSIVDNTDREILPPSQYDTIDKFLTYSRSIWGACATLLLGCGGTLIWFSDTEKLEPDRIFWLNQVLKYLVISAIQYICGVMVKSHGVKVNYTRKIVHVSYFIWPQILDQVVLDYSSNLYSEIWNIYLVLLLLFFASEPFRQRFQIVRTLYLSVDRPEDQPYTLFWFASQIMATLVVFFPFVLYFRHQQLERLLFIPILINGLGDGLAEPVGVRYGRHQYTTRSCLSSRRYTRSYEGSLCVFLVSLITICSYYQYFTASQFSFVLITLPILATLAEAYAPHTWDSPLIYLTVLCILLVSTYLP